MKVAYFGYDFFSDCLSSILEDHEVLKVFSFKTDNKYNFNDQIFDLISDRSISIQLSRVSRKDIIELEDKGCELLVSAAYPYRIPISHKIKGINIHPSLLPEGKGPWPLPYIILREHKVSGVTIHKLAEKMDSGDILMQQEFKVSAYDNLESLSCKSQILAKQMVPKLLSDFDGYWSNSISQCSGSYWKFPTDEEQTIKWSYPVSKIDKIVRAYGKLDSMAFFDNKYWVIQDATVWQQSHDYEVGSIVHRTNNEIVVAASDGLVCLRSYTLDEDFCNHKDT